MEVLHISTAAMMDKFYLTWLGIMSRENKIQQKMYIPCNKADFEDENNRILRQYEENNINVVALPLKKSLDRFFYFKKIYKFMRALTRNFDLSNVNIIHAHTLFTDGGVAYLLNRKFGLPYVVAVRTTDTDFFMKWKPYLKPFARKILERAQQIIFITPDICNSTFGKLYGKRSKKSIRNKCVIIPNGVDPFWIENRRNLPKKFNNSVIRLIQVSRLNRNKNVDKSIRAVSLLRQQGIEIELYVLGNGVEKERLCKLIESESLQNYIHLCGFVSDKAKVKEFYNSCDIFVMPSTNETFGISYIEAMTQGLPVIGLQSTGISGYCMDKETGIFIDTPEPSRIAEAVNRIINEYESYSENCIKESASFDWELICKQYFDIYSKVKY